ncbi:Mov34/MPN/PAD-1 family protein [Vibrio europaeus]|uniref:ThiF family adenylyltransferase n=1 Tax=Vibrio europaeus TaxID=300876 RepID=UPI00233F3721|nr:ThiF family adenylyltransferase [Vibrio europaeus]MDC5806388.1 Mov34/MPN/PAD-1 family protein [Vibrio europaeus]MDC5807787.1 Mov34/MPN/PAD-1 family protein [Vibrio europaeus]MDC5807997.1 Mov34/MPN/PAD-1 family protein [Vibrio europaeus]MDC5830823.1 Mov34/MPN/PAD-1 family protein [Vibrio europaeus]MDC5830903.1 Mov34/MPN/PAD-1 family protein [Vibrio europaeus]
MTIFFPVNGKEIKQDKVELYSSTAMIKAIKKNPNTTLIDIRIRENKTQLAEFITVDICNDDIPSRNKVGISYKERICYVFTREDSVPSTYALRKEFPMTMHQNSPSENDAKSLCLYLEPKDVVAASWTAEKHLKRTSWWLTKAATGELHHDDQGIEQLFFNPTSTIILPYDYDHESNQGKHLTAVAYHKEATNEGGGIVVTEWQEGSNRNDSVLINVVNVTTTPVVHGIVNRNVNTLSKLDSLLEPLGIDIIRLVRIKILEIIRSGLYRLDIDATVFVLTFPMRRSSESPIETRQTIAITVIKSLDELAVEFEVTNKVRAILTARNGELFPLTNNSIDFDIDFMECLKVTSGKDRRLQSGISKPFGKGAIIGAGALGGALVDFWVKAGWGTWTVVDNDSFRPHNFTRHVISPAALGMNKATIVAGHYSRQYSDCELTGIGIDAKRFDAPEVKKYLNDTELVIDASASISYPRAVSTIKNAPRHIAAFFAPNSSGAVLLVEDKRRKVRLASLEAQYYRALINNSVGDQHLVSATEQFSSGVSCRDISFVMSHSRVMAYSSLLAEQIIKSSSQNEPMIMIWQENIETGDRVSFKINAHKDITNSYHTLNKFKIHWDEGIEERVRELRANSLPNETGGILIGYHDMTQKSVYIVDALPAPTDSVGTPVSFVRGTEGVLETLGRVAIRTANNVGYIGEWHSHPKGASARMSELDMKQLAQLAVSLSDDGLPAYQMIVGESEIKVYEKAL